MSHWLFPYGDKGANLPCLTPALQHVPPCPPVLTPPPKCSILLPSFFLRPHAAAFDWQRY
ncbi:TPA: hypothetical protein JD178_01140 [Cronobacter sakazakii]|nr:hypothetical protein FZI10_13805 [Cronobacter sakazakii]KAB0865039.1 hypothetical protein FZH98_15340 [Cronobacter sakazakii]KAB1037514.1 hypothetical protein AUN09_14310 [Cronobacter sakazakii]KAB1060728.1 hypothetical protein AUN10_10150 [Cronobacter sakazakii]MCI0215380.1 hypothetical protein [Cronobacter sakazakii]